MESPEPPSTSTVRFALRGVGRALTRIPQAAWVIAAIAMIMPVVLACEASIGEGLVAFRQRWFRGDLRQLLETTQQFGDLATLLITAVLVIRLDSGRWRRLWDMALASGLTALVCFVMKTVVGRPRPTFTGEWLIVHGWTWEKATHARFQSMPSSHTAAAMALALFLIAAYPRLRILVVPLVALVGLSRVMLASHYISDVLVGGVLGYVMARPIVAGRWGSRGAWWVGRRLGLRSGPMPPIPPPPG